MKGNSSSRTCDAEAVGAAGLRQDVRRRLVLVEQTLPLGEVIVSEEVKGVVSKGVDGLRTQENVHVRSERDVDFPVGVCVGGAESDGPVTVVLE